jgi:predicted ArsR family transcriptional regulator
MGKPGPDPETTTEAVLQIYSQLNDPCMPLTAQEVADELDCSRRTALRRLKDLEKADKIKSKKVGGRSRVWWNPSTE